MPENLTREVIEGKLKEVQERLARYEAYQRLMEESGNQILEVVADKGYENAEDITRCLENGIIPHVIMEDGKSGYELELTYKKVEADTASIKPEAYKEVISDMRAKEGYFIRDPERNLVYCPAGDILRQKCIKKNGNFRYTKKMPVNIAKIEISVIREKTNGKKSILQRIRWRNLVKSGWKQRRRNISRAVRKQNSDMKK